MQNRKIGSACQAVAAWRFHPSGTEAREWDCTSGRSKTSGSPVADREAKKSAFAAKRPIIMGDPVARHK